MGHGLATHHKLQVIQAQLLQSEKMSSIGQLAADIARYAIEKHGVITIATGCGDGRVWIEIGDTGSGMTD
ncbi:hypothetical protein NP603_14890 [Methylomonas sp. SURF-1]|uniref:Uncharacterized protein n=1 Tax=Methylomonas aurea TaxID=2952224 RepID=A0ABT1UL58_9GAMM|nr:hypothetical protein [Methylomonas sp. SURF-1]MCQ8182405.1 hypothetical protein [Methylomonas sp. SURF-1]